MSIVIAVIIFGIIVIVHELGHFIAARKSGVLVEEFAIGMGPIVYKRQRGDTIYSIRLIPVGGFCKMLGDENANDDERSFSCKKLHKRIIILASGALMNFALAYIIFVVITLINGYSLPVVQELEAGRPAETAGMQKGDRVIRLNNTKINIFEDLAFTLEKLGSKPVAVGILRDGVIYEKMITPYRDESGSYKFGFLCQYKTGLMTGRTDGFESASILDCLSIGFYQIIFFIKVTVAGIIQLFTFNMSLDDIAGPIGIVTTINDEYQRTISKSVIYTILSMSQLAALLSANLGVFNLLPLPALDGGRLVFLFIEAIRRKPMNQEKEGMVHFIGFVLLMILAAFIAFSDIMKII